MIIFWITDSMVREVSQERAPRRMTRNPFPGRLEDRITIALLYFIVINKVMYSRLFLDRVCANYFVCPILAQQ